MRLLKQSTAITFRAGPFLDDADGKTAETGLTIAQSDIQISKAGGAFAQTSAGSPTTTHDADGWYQCPLTTTDTNTVGLLSVQIAMSGALPVWEHFFVLPAVIYDWITAGAAPLSPTTAGRTLDVSTGGEAGVDWANVGSPTTTVALSGTTIGTLTTYTGNTPQTGDAYAIVNSGTFGNAAIKGYVDDIGTAGAGLTAIPWNAAWDAEVQSEVQDAIEVNQLDHLIAVADPGSIVANSSLWAALVSKSATPTYSSYVNTSDSLEAQRDNVGTAGANLTAADDAVITAIGALNNIAATDVWAAGTRTLTALPSIPANWLTAAGTATDFGAEIAGAVWDLATSGHTTSGTFGAAMNAAGSAGDPWATALPGAYGSGTAGFILGTNLNALITSRMATYTQPTGFLAASFPASVAAVGSAMTLTSGERTAIATAAFVTQMVESYAVDGVAPTLAQALLQIQQRLMEFEIAGTTITVKKLDGSTTAFTLTMDDDTTPTSSTRSA